MEDLESKIQYLEAVVTRLDNMALKQEVIIEALIDSHPNKSSLRTALQRWGETSVATSFECNIQDEERFATLSAAIDQLIREVSSQQP